MLCILAIFIPALFMVGAAKAMFLPLSLAVGFSMVASYLLSSTLVPILSVWVLRGHKGAVAGDRQRVGAFARFQQAYTGLARGIVRWRWLVAAAYLVVVGVIIVLLGRGLGTEIFPRVEAGQLQVRLRAPAGTQIDGTEAVALRALELINQEAGAQNVRLTLGFLGVHGSSYPINFIYLWNGGPEEGVMQVQLNQGAPVRIVDLGIKKAARWAAAHSSLRFLLESTEDFSV
jgi:multidrug efflux pump subunit AcrB